MAGEGYMEKYDEHHRQAHQLATIAAYIIKGEGFHRHEGMGIGNAEEGDDEERTPQHQRFMRDESIRLKSIARNIVARIYSRRPA